MSNNRGDFTILYVLGMVSSIYFIPGMDPTMFVIPGQFSLYSLYQISFLYILHTRTVPPKTSQLDSSNHVINQDSSHYVCHTTTVLTISFTAQQFPLCSSHQGSSHHVLHNRKVPSMFFAAGQFPPCPSHQDSPHYVLYTRTVSTMSFTLGLVPSLDIHPGRARGQKSLYLLLVA